AGAANLRLAESYQPCPHNATRVEEMPDGHIHHARELCAECGAFFGWLAKPQTLEKGWINTQRLNQLLRCSALDLWERRFVTGMLKLRWYSPRQQLWIDRLCEQHLWRRAES